MSDLSQTSTLPGTSAAKVLGCWTKALTQTENLLSVSRTPFCRKTSVVSRRSSFCASGRFQRCGLVPSLGYSAVARRVTRKKCSPVRQLLSVVQPTQPYSSASGLSVFITGPFLFFTVLRGNSFCASLPLRQLLSVVQPTQPYSSASGFSVFITGPFLVFTVLRGNSFCASLPPSQVLSL